MEDRKKSTGSESVVSATVTSDVDTQPGKSDSLMYIRADNRVKSEGEGASTNIEMRNPPLVVSSSPLGNIQEDENEFDDPTGNQESFFRDEDEISEESVIKTREISISASFFSTTFIKSIPLVGEIVCWRKKDALFRYKRIASDLVLIELIHTFFLFCFNSILQIYFMFIVLLFRHLRDWWQFNLAMMIISLCYPFLCPILTFIKPVYFRGLLRANRQGKVRITLILIIFSFIQLLGCILFLGGGPTGIGVYQLVYAGIEVKRRYNLMLVLLVVFISIFVFSWIFHIILIAVNAAVVIAVYYEEYKKENNFIRLQEEEDESEYNNL